MKSWYTIQNKTDTTGSISIHDEIGFWGVTAKDFIDELNAKFKNVTHIELSLHSPGGNVFEGIAIYNVLKLHPAKVTARVEGLAASIASVILMAADIITMPENAYLMIHNTTGGAWGNSDNLREMADLMEKLQATIRNIYLKRTGITEDKLKDLMAAETWMTGAEALDMGFADVVLDKVDMAAKAGDYSKYFKAAPLADAAVVIDDIKNERDLEKFLRDAGGLSRSQATGIVAKAKAIIQREAGGDVQAQKLAELSARLGKVSIPTSLI